MLVTSVIKTQMCLNHLAYAQIWMFLIDRIMFLPRCLCPNAPKLWLLCYMAKDK